MAGTAAAAPVGPTLAPLPTSLLGSLEGHEGSVMAVRYNGKNLSVQLLPLCDV